MTLTSWLGCSHVQCKSHTTKASLALEVPCGLGLQPKRSSRQALSISYPMLQTQLKYTKYKGRYARKGVLRHSQVSQCVTPLLRQQSSGPKPSPLAGNRVFSTVNDVSSFLELLPRQWWCLEGSHKVLCHPAPSLSDHTTQRPWQSKKDLPRAGGEKTGGRPQCPLSTAKSQQEIPPFSIIKFRPQKWGF